ncbi:MAG: hypothetical protein RBR86_09660 [Pseudobdellovibrionaceae bacterium]|jgi:BMFP domain-containing protein YqiC|nr:hypothetical protein [Pseudobdellovibrionaceae bacterium]
MPLDNKLFDDLTRVAGGAASVLAAIGKQVGEGLKDQMGDKLPANSFSSPAANDDVDRLQGVVTKLRLEQEEMKARIAELEALLGVAAKKAPAKKNTPKKSAAKKAPANKVAVKKSATKKPAKKRA